MYQTPIPLSQHTYNTQRVPYSKLLCESIVIGGFGSSIAALLYDMAGLPSTMAVIYYPDPRGLIDLSLCVCRWGAGIVSMCGANDNGKSTPLRTVLSRGCVVFLPVNLLVGCRFGDFFWVRVPSRLLNWLEYYLSSIYIWCDEKIRWIIFC